MGRIKKLCSILLLAVLVAMALCTLSACNIKDLKNGTALHKDGVYYTVYAFKRYAIVHGFDAKEGAQVYEIPSHVKHKGFKYPVKRFAPENNNYSFYMYDIVAGGYPKELVVPETLESLQLSWYNDEQVDALQKITVDANNKHYTSVDGVVYTKDKSALVFYPPAKVSNSLLLPKETTNIRDMLGVKERLSSIAVEAGNKVFSAKDGVMFNADGSKIVCYPLNKTDETYTIPSTLTVLSTNCFASNKHLKYFEVEAGNPVFSSYKGNLYSVDGSILLYRQRSEGLNVLELSDNIKTIGRNLLQKVDILYVPKGLDRIVFDKYNNYYGYSDENDENPISQVKYLYFEGDEVPFCLRYAELTQNVKFGVTREQFEAEMEELISRGEQL